MARLRVVLDTNVLVSGLAYPESTPGKLIGAWKGGGLEVVLSHFILDDLTRVLPRLNHVLHWPETPFAELADVLTVLCDVVEPVAIEGNALRDPADSPVLGTLLAAKADYLLTGDADLFALADRYPILTPAQFWARHGSGA